jgi:hypothetical protein
MSDTDSDTDDERAPLVRSAATAGTAGGGTFARQRVKYFV